MSDDWSDARAAGDEMEQLQSMREETEADPAGDDGEHADRARDRLLDDDGGGGR